MSIDLKKKYAGAGYLIVESEEDTTNIVCRYGHIYADGDHLCASLDNGTRSQVLQLRKLGESVMDGDFGELTIRFPASQFKAVARVLKPRQRVLAKAKTP